MTVAEVGQCRAGIEQLLDIVAAREPLTAPELGPLPRGHLHRPPRGPEEHLARGSGGGHRQAEEAGEVRRGIAQRRRRESSLPHPLAKPIIVAWQQGRTTALPERVGAEVPDGNQAGLEPLDQRQAILELVTRPRFHCGEIQPGQGLFLWARPEPEQLADRLVGGDAAPADRRVDGLAVGVEPVARHAQQPQVVRRRPGGKSPEPQRPAELIEHGLLADLVAVQLQAGVAQAHGVESVFDDLQRRLLLGDEEDRLAPADRLGDQVRDRLRLACAGRPLDDQVASPKHVEEGQRLRTVRVHDVMDVLGRQAAIEVLVGADRGAARGSRPGAVPGGSGARSAGSPPASWPRRGRGT